jgi:hypothetical protein
MLSQESTALAQIERRQMSYRTRYNRQCYGYRCGDFRCNDLPPHTLARVSGDTFTNKMLYPLFGQFTR